jgi:iron(III) transport system substrate-binding protein
MKRYYVGILVLLALVVGLPFLLRDRREAIPVTKHTIVLLSPHSESIKAEFTRAFRQWFQLQNPGEDVYLDWRSLGGASDIARYLRSEYFHAFQQYWEQGLGREWSIEVAQAFANPAISLPADASEDNLQQQARRAFLGMNQGIGADVLFGGGSFEFGRFADIGILVNAGTHERYPERFSGAMGIPQNLSGEPYWDSQGRWYGAVISSFGIIFNRDSLRRLGIDRDPSGWRDLADERLYGEVGVADPTKSGSINKAFEMVIQQAMQERERELLAEGVAPADASKLAVREGWISGLQLIQRIAANARYFTDSANKPSIDVSQGDCAIGMSIDFYGRLQQEATERRSGRQRFAFVSPEGGTVYSVDPIGLLRGAPNRQLAQQFIDFVMSEEGQKLWYFKRNTPGGPSRTELHRPPVLPVIYQPQYDAYRADPAIKPYEAAASFVYHPQWTGPAFRQIAFIVKAALMDVHHELRESWVEIIEAGMPEEAVKVWSDMSAVSYDWVRTDLARLLNNHDHLAQVEEARKLSLHFRQQYRKAAEIARQYRQ